MSHALTKLLFHVVFRTKRHQPFLQGVVSQKINGYMTGIARNQQAHLIRAGGMPDHRHLLLELKPTVNIADMVRLLKANASKWARETFPELRDFAWQTGYAAFSVSLSARNNVIKYIDNQEEHHRTTGFDEELKKLLRRHGVAYDPVILQDE